MKKYLLPLLLMFVCGLTVQAQSPPSEHKLLLYQHEIPTAEYISSHVSEANALPFDGVLFSIPSMDAMRSGGPISVAQFKTELVGMKAAAPLLTKVRHNYVLLRLVKTGPFSTQTSTVASNFANLAEAARDAGLEGIAFDNEDYENDTWDPATTCPGQTTQQCQVQAAQAGKTVMQAMIAKWPDVKLFTMLGPFFGDATVFQQILNEAPLPKHLILGAYTFGFNEATIGTQATYIDGAEKYSVHTADVAQRDYNLRKVAIPRDSPLIPTAVRDAWAQKISLGYTFYDEQSGTPARWRDDATVNLNAADEYAWAFSFNNVWIGPVGSGQKATQEWINATSAGRVAAGMSPFPVAASLTPTVTTSTSPTTSVTPINSCNMTGDANHDGKITLTDFEVWRRAYVSQ